LFWIERTTEIAKYAEGFFVFGCKEPQRSLRARRVFLFWIERTTEIAEYAEEYFLVFG